MTNINELFNTHNKLCLRAVAIMKAKNHDYTDGSNDPFANFRMSEFVDVKPEIGILMRILDKIARLKTFANKGILEVKDEDVDNSICDIINYLVLLKGMFDENARSNSN